MTDNRWHYSAIDNVNMLIVHVLLLFDTTTASSMYLSVCPSVRLLTGFFLHKAYRFTCLLSSLHIIIPVSLSTFVLCLKLAHALVLCNISTATYPLLSLLTRPVMYVFLQHALSVIFTFLHLWRGPSADDSPIGPDKVYHFSLPQHSLSVIFTFPHLCRGTVSWCQS